MALFRLSTATRNGIVTSIGPLIDAGFSAGTIKIYDGIIPTTADNSLSGQNLLAQFLFSRPPLLAASGGQISANTTNLQTFALQSGFATWARIQDGNGNNLFDCDVGSTVNNTLQLNSTALVARGPLSIISFTITMPAGA